MTVGLMEIENIDCCILLIYGLTMWHRSKPIYCHQSYCRTFISNIYKPLYFFYEKRVYKRLCIFQRLL